MNPQIFMDMDGVIADFFRGSIAWHGKEFDIVNARWDFMDQLGFDGPEDPAFWTPLENTHFWRNLEPHEDGFELLHRCMDRFGVENITILSSASVRHSTDGKRDWLDRYFPELKKGAMFSTEKWRAVAPCKLLVDDYYRNITDFCKKGGHGLMIPRPWNVRGNETDGRARFDVDKVFDELLYYAGLISLQDQSSGMQ